MESRVGRNLVLMSCFVSGLESEPLLDLFWEVPSRTVPPGAGASTLTYL